MEEKLKNNLTPFWESSLIYNEMITMAEGENGAVKAPLIFQPSCILSVRSATLDTLYEEEKDWVFRDGCICRTADSRIPYFTKDQLYPAQSREGGTIPRFGEEGYILYGEGNFFHKHQLAVTYTCQHGQWGGLLPEYAGAALPRTIKCLRRGKQLKMMLYGDSIAHGCNASSLAENVPPHLPPWGEMVAEGLRDHYGAEVEFLNPSVPGKKSDWGAEHAHELVACHEPDLVIIAFGMNDGSMGMPPEEYRENIRSMIHTVREANPDAEFLLASTLLPNREAGVTKKQSFWGEQLNYLPELRRLCTEEKAALADMTTLHQDLLKKKRFIDMTGNNVNHPNDFLIRWYAQFILTMLKD